jgi:hypothetical protein
MYLQVVVKHPLLLSAALDTQAWVVMSWSSWQSSSSATIRGTPIGCIYPDLQGCLNIYYQHTFITYPVATPPGDSHIVYHPPPPSDPPSGGTQGMACCSSTPCLGGSLSMAMWEWGSSVQRGQLDSLGVPSREKIWGGEVWKSDWSRFISRGPDLSAGDQVYQQGTRFISRGPDLSAGDKVYQQGTRFISRGQGLSAGHHRGDSIRHVGTHIQGISTDGKGMATRCRRGVWEGCTGTTNRGPPHHPLTRDSWSISCTTGSMQDHMGV